MIKKVVKKAVVKAVLKPANGFELFTLEDGAPLPRRGYHDSELANKLIDLLSKMKVKQSFVIPKSKKSYLDVVVKKEFPQYKVLRSAILPEKTFIGFIELLR